MPKRIKKNTLKEVSMSKEKTVYLDFSISNNASNDDWERHDGLLVMFSEYLFSNSIGTWSGRESALSNNQTRLRTNFWLVLEKSKEQALERLKQMTKNFSLEHCTEIKLGENASQTEKSIIQRIKKEKSFSWTYYKFKGRPKKINFIQTLDGVVSAEDKTYWAVYVKPYTSKSGKEWQIGDIREMQFDEYNPLFDNIVVRFTKKENAEKYAEENSPTMKTF